MTGFPLTGGCNCGAVRYEVTEPLLIASYCHCKRCQRRSGAAASPSAHPAAGSFQIVEGEDRLKKFICELTRNAQRLYYALCHSPKPHATKLKGTYVFRVGAINQGALTLTPVKKKSP